MIDWTLKTHDPKLLIAMILGIIMQSDPICVIPSLRKCIPQPMPPLFPMKNYSACLG